jgi:peptidoglycan/LPS O-acetylase OafA/YrhL
LFYQKKNVIIIGGQFVFFSVFYSSYCDEISYVSKEQFFSWYVVYLLVFVLVKQLYKKTNKKVIGYAAKMSYVIYISHGFFGFALTSYMLHEGIDKNATLICSMVMCLLYGALVYESFRYIKCFYARICLFIYQRIRGNNI